MTMFLRTAGIMSLMAAARPADAANTSSPNKAISKPGCDSSAKVSIKHSSGSVYVEKSGSKRGGCVTLKEIWQELGSSGPLYPVDKSSGDASTKETGTWLLEDNLIVEDGITLQVHGKSAGGDADELRLLSTSKTFINLRAHGGSLDFVSTKVFAWDTSKNAVRTDESKGRSYISAVSEITSGETCSGKAKNNMGEARMDIDDSEMAYLGYYGAESYGLTWKVRGYCKDGSNRDVFDDVNVYGNIYDSDIHHNHFGVYTYGHQQGDWRRNKMHHNTAYGFDPHDDSDFLTIHDNTVYNNGNHGIIASKRCNGVSIQGNEVYGGSSGSVGIFLHRSSDDATVKGNYVHDNGDAGMALLEIFDADVSGNTFEDNKYGIRMSVGCADNEFSNNKITGSSKYNVYTYEGSDDPWVTNSGRSKDNIFSDNTITGSEESIKLKDADGTEFIDNTFKSAKIIRFVDADDTIMSGNTGLDDAKLKVSSGACFDKKSDSDYKPTC